MKKKLKELLKYFFNDEEVLLQLKEIEWAHIFKESIRGKEYLTNLPLNVGRWAGNYSFFYILNRILNDYRPSSILDLGLGESSKFISAYIENELTDSRHVIIEQDENWIKSFNSRFNLSQNSEILFCNLVEKNINSFSVLSYENFTQTVKIDFDFYIVDGPFGSERFSRYDIVELVENFTYGKEFIILMDDSGRQGEIDTINSIIRILESKKISVHIGHYTGNKQNTIIASDKYKYSISF